MKIISVPYANGGLLLAIVMGFGAHCPLEAQTYTITELPPLPGDTASAAFAINESGQAAGESGDFAVIWTNGVPFNLQTVAASSSWTVAFALNDSGYATGDLFPSANNSSAFIWRGNTMERIIPPPGQYIVEAYAMNNAGTVVGTGGTTWGYRWTNGSYLSLEPLPGDYSAFPYAINNYGIIAGHSNGLPVTWIGTIPHAVPLPAGASSGLAWGINDLGAVVGEFYSGGSSKPFVWTSSLGAQALPMPVGTTSGYAYALNDLGLIIGDAGGQPVVWRKNSSGAYEVALIASLLSNGSGWDRLDLYAINEAGQIAGDGRLNGQGRGFVLNPGPALTLTLRTDADRSGTTDYDSPDDMTAPGRPFYFWTNDDHDATGADVADGPVDSADDRILNPVLVTATGGNSAVARDLEDFARLAFNLTPDLKTALEAGATLRLEAAGAGTMHLFSTPSAGDETRYLTDEPFAVSLITNVATDVALPSSVDANGIMLWENIETLIKPEDWVVGRVRFLWEGVTPGACVLTLRANLADGTEIVSAPVHISLHPVRDYFENVRALPIDGFPPPYDTNGQSPVMSWGLTHPQTAGPVDQQNLDLVWVHGWRLPKWERQNWAEMMFKRLWHAGYEGRFHAFTWPTLSGDDPFFETGPDGKLSFDRSEFRAWKSGTAFDGYLRVLRNAHSGGRLALVAHSMGTVVTGEALRLGAPADLQIMMQAAVSAGCYDTRLILNDADLLAKETRSPTPDFDVDLGYRGFLSNITVPTINYYNVDDFALQTATLINGYINVSWLRNQLTKPDNPSGRGAYEFRDDIPVFYSGKKRQREITDVHESLAFLARSRTRAVGAEPGTGRTPSDVSLGIFQKPANLQALYGFTGQDNEHSAQFNRPIQRQLIGFYASIIEAVSSRTAP